MRVLHLVGSAVSDFHAELSLLYARDCLAHVAAGHETHLAHVSPDLSWRFPASLDTRAITAAPPVPVAEALARIAALDVDVVVPQMFCLPGMTTYRGVFDLLGIPYLGNPPDVMALGAHKARARAVVASAGVAVPAGELLRRGDAPTLAPPVVIKPVDTDNSLGLALVRHSHDYDGALADAFTHAREVLVESYVELGREVRCGLLERGGQLVGLPLEEYRMDAATKPIRGADDKISSGDDEMRLVGKDDRAWIVDVDDPVTATVWAAAKLAHVAMGARHYSLFDFRVDPDGRAWFLEAGLYCSFARQSVIPTMARAAGIELPELFASVAAEALRRG